MEPDGKRGETLNLFSSNFVCPPPQPLLHLPRQRTVIWEFGEEKGEAASILSFV